MAQSQTGNPKKIAQRDDYEDLTPKMQAVVDAAAKNPDANHDEITEIASESLGDEGVSRSYVPIILEEQQHLVKQRQEMYMNEREEGSETTTGDPFEALEADDSGVQLIQDRPVKDTGRDVEGVSDDAPEDAQIERIKIAFTREDIETALTSEETSDWLRKRLVEELVADVFD